MSLQQLNRHLTHPAIGAFGFAFLIWLLLPKMVVVIDDDFGYLRSVVETCQRGRPWTYEWLTPWAASMSVLAASLFKISGSFSFAIRFSLSVSAALAFFGLASHLRSGGASPFKSWFIAALLLGSPTVLFMLVMFTSVPLYLGCMWMCIHLSQRKSWCLFFLVWFVGLAARQSAVVWLALPGWAVVSSMWDTRSWWPRDRTAWAPLTVVMAGCLAVLGMKLGMNPTYGQAIVTAATRKLDLKATPLALGVLTLTGGYGWSCFAGLFLGSDKASGVPQRLRSLARCLALIPAVIAGLLGAQWFHGQIVATHSAYGDPYASAWMGLTGMTAALGIVLNPVRPRWEMLLAGLGTMLLLALYGARFDYYYIDPFFWGFAMAVVPNTRKESVSPTRPVCLAHGVIMLIMALFAVWNVRCYVRQKYELDRAAALNRIYEQAIRDGKIRAHEIGLAPFGYVGWRFEHYFHTHEGRNSPDLGGFLKCVDGWTGKEGMAVNIDLPKPISHLRGWFPTHNTSALDKDPRAVVVAKLRTGILWSYKATYFLKRTQGPTPREGKPMVNYADYQDSPFPLNDQEWMTLITKGALDRVGQ